ncbi:hypothetical protein nbrc107696_27620 [Gordonia spumicola]|uniref:Uncharacterized protein n=1 Tax=Gordonia spumicola TaxID=589161 RepID=A0A7I9VAA1_9ACTN|nr:hypothetical protein [Gordonia spumicola]GEE02316.1 hypothetical protein nbrc107696_27620 [Gordonia spumicola]
MTHAAPRPSDRIDALAAVAAVATVAVFAAPAYLAGATSTQRDDLPGAAGDAFAAFWSGSTTALDELASYWTRFHAAKAVLATILLIAAIVLTRALAQRLGARTGRVAGADVALGTGLIVSSSLTALAALVVMANIQGAFVPRSSLLSAVPPGAAHPTDTSSMVDDFGRYHLVMAIVAGLAAAVTATALAIGWRRRPREPRRAVIVSRAYLSAMALATLAALVVFAANVSTAVDPTTALDAFFASV